MLSCTIPDLTAAQVNQAETKEKQRWKKNVPGNAVINNKGVSSMVESAGDTTGREWQLLNGATNGGGIATNGYNEFEKEPNGRGNNKEWMRNSTKVLGINKKHWDNKEDINKKLLEVEQKNKFKSDNIHKVNNAGTQSPKQIKGQKHKEAQEQTKPQKMPLSRRQPHKQAHTRTHTQPHKQANSRTHTQPQKHSSTQTQKVRKSDKRYSISFKMDDVQSVRDLPTSFPNVSSVLQAVEDPVFAYVGTRIFNGGAIVLEVGAVSSAFEWNLLHKKVFYLTFVHYSLYCPLLTVA